MKESAKLSVFGTEDFDESNSNDEYNSEEDVTVAAKSHLEKSK